MYRWEEWLFTGALITLVGLFGYALIFDDSEPLHVEFTAHAQVSPTPGGGATPVPNPAPVLPAYTQDPKTGAVTFNYTVTLPQGLSLGGAISATSITGSGNINTTGGQYQINGVQISASTALSDGKTGGGNLVGANQPIINQPTVNGVTDGSTVGAGGVGEVQSCSATAVSLVTSASKDVCTVPLTAGDWVCSGSVSFNPAGTTTISSVIAGATATANTLPSDPDESFVTVNGAMTTGTPQRLTSGPKEFNSASAQTVRIVAQAGFGTSTMAVGGKYICRRVR